MPSSAVADDFELREAMFAGSDPEGGEEVMLTGGSGVIGPDANWITGPVRNEEVILYADLDLAHASRERYAMDIVGHYNRPDIFDLTVDRRKRSQISWLADADHAQAGEEAAEVSQ